MKPHFLNDRPCNINDKENHNVSSATIKNSALNSQKHCWLMHRLYDDFSIDWADIVRINNIWFDKYSLPIFNRFRFKFIVMVLEYNKYSKG